MQIVIGNMGRRTGILITLVLLTFFIGKNCPAQIKANPTSKIRFQDIRTYLLNDYKIEQGFLDTACVNTIVLVKFKILNSKIDSVEFTKSVPPPIRKALGKALRLDNGGFILIDGKSYEKKTIVIPIQFAYLSRCRQVAPIALDSNGAIINQKKDRTSLELAFREMLNFDSGDKASLDCLWLSSMSFTSLF